MPNKTGYSSTDGHKTHPHIPAGSLRFGHGKGQTLEGVIKIGFGSFYDHKAGTEQNRAYFASHVGLPYIIGSAEEPYNELKKRALKIRGQEGKIEIMDFDGKWKPFFLYVGCQIVSCLKRGKGILSWPTFQHIISFDDFLKLPEKEVKKELRKLGFDGGREEEMMELLRLYKQNLY